MRLSKSLVKFAAVGSGQVVTAFAISLTLLAAAGCGGGASDTRDRASASGKAVFDGKPIPAGYVVFTHVDSGTMAMCPITDGEYSSVSGEGPVLGKNVVTVTALDKAGGDPLFGAGKSIEVEVASSGYTGDVTIAADEVSTARPMDIDEEEKALNAAAENK